MIIDIMYCRSRGYFFLFKVDLFGLFFLDEGKDKFD